MKGKIPDFDDWTYDNCSAVLEEAGLRLFPGRTDIYRCEPIDATEVIAVLEMWYDVIFSQTEHDRLANRMRCKSIGRPSLMSWLTRCHKKPIRLAKWHDMPLFENKEDK